MLKGHTFNLQTFTSEAFALFIDKFLNERCGVAKGCALSNTNNSVTIGDGYFVIRGRFLEIISGVTLSNITTNGFYSLVCEIDLSKTNTEEQLNQAEIKVIRSTNAYPTLIQQDITGSGTLYQYEFARFKVESGTITNFTDKRTFVDFDSIYDEIEAEADDIIEDIREALANVLDGSAYVLKNNIRTLTGTLENIPIGGYGYWYHDYPFGWTKDNTVVISAMATPMKNYDSYVAGSLQYGEVSSGDSSGSYMSAINPQVIFKDDKIAVLANNGTGTRKTVNYKVVLMKIS